MRSILTILLETKNQLEKCYRDYYYFFLEGFRVAMISTMFNLKLFFKGLRVTWSKLLSIFGVYWD